VILTDREIWLALESGQIVIEPKPDLSQAISSTSIDLTLARSGLKWDAPTGTRIRPGQPGWYDEAKKWHSRIEFSSFELRPHEFVLGWTRERIELPVTSRLAARVEGKSSLARVGLAVHITAPTIHAGFEGDIQLEIVNQGNLSILLNEGLRVCQLIFETTLGTPETGYKGMFKSQRSTGKRGT
jgi:dCTP deaminase